MFTLEINGTAIVVTNAAEAEARELLQSDDFKEDLKTLTAEGKPLWDGIAPLTVRASTEDEIDSFDEALNDEEYEDEDEDETDDDDEPVDVVFLVEVDETGDDDDEDSASA